MHIYIYPHIQGELLKNLQRAISESGHQIGEHPGFSSYGVRITGVQRSHHLDPEQDIILKDPNLVSTVPQKAHIVNIGSLWVVGSNMSLTEWLRLAPDPLTAKL